MFYCVVNHLLRALSCVVAAKQTSQPTGRALFPAARTAALDGGGIGAVLSGCPSPAGAAGLGTVVEGAGTAFCIAGSGGEAEAGAASGGGFTPGFCSGLGSGFSSLTSLACDSPGDCCPR